MDAPLLIPKDMLLAFSVAALRIPEHLREGFYEYVCRGRPTGHFLQAVIAGDLFEAVRRADPVSRTALCLLVDVLVEYAPANCWGSAEIYEVWVAKGAEARRLARD